MWSALLILTVLLQEPLPGPPQDVAEAARTEIRERWKSKFAKRSPAAKLALADLLEEAARLEADSAIRFVLTEEELRLVASAGDIDRAVVVAGRLNQEFSGSHGKDLLAGSLADWVRLREEAAAFAAIVDLELNLAMDPAMEPPMKPAQMRALGVGWEGIRERCPRRSKINAARRAHRWLTLGLRSVEPASSKDEASLAALEALDRCEREIESADRKTRSFTLLTGHWIVRDGGGAIGCYEFSEKGHVQSATFIDNNGDVKLQYDVEADRRSQKRKNIRPLKYSSSSGRSIVASGLLGPDPGLPFQHLWIERGVLLIVGFAIKCKGPGQWSQGFAGQHSAEHPGLALGVAHADVALRRGRLDLCTDILDAAEALNREDAEPSYALQLAAARASVSVVRFAGGSLGQQVGNGECSTLAEQALRQAGATWPGGYAFGDELDDLSNLRAGDVLQFEGVHIDQASGGYVDFPHHTAIVSALDRGGAVTLLHQNFGDGPKVVQKLTVDLRRATSGTVQGFRPTPSR